MKMPKRNMPKSYAGIGFAALIAAIPSFAQNESEGEDVFELSPFTVEAEEGYRAQNTLSGTRLKSNLGDIASSISVFTEEFLDDIGATNIQDAYLYSVNTENEDEYAANDTEGDDVSSTNTNRVRGLVASSSTRGFFNTQFRADTYNTERFTLARGPNSILYGIGSPAGLMNATLKRAKLNKDSYEVSYRFDSESGNRVSVDVNKVLVDDKLAIRFAAIEQDRTTWKEPEVDDESRRYVAATFKPLENTTLTANYEHMKNTRSKARGRLAKQEISQWQAAGSPYIDPFNDRISYDQGATWSSTAVVPSGYGLPREGQEREISSLNEDEQFALGFNRDRGGSFAERRFFMHGHLDLDPSAFNAIEDPATRQLYADMGMQGLIFQGASSTVGRDDPQKPVYTFTPQDNLVATNFNLHGLTSATDYKGENYGVKIEQKITDNFFVEAALNHEDWSRYFVDPIRGENLKVFADINYFIPLWDLSETVGSNGLNQDDDPDNWTGPSYQWDGRPTVNDNNVSRDDRLRDSDGNFVLIENPNVGRYYVEGQLIGFDEEISQDNLRFTASYELDLTENNKWLGKHALAFLYQKDETERRRTKIRAFNDLSYHVGDGRTVADIGDGQNNLANRYYLDLSGAPDPNGLKYPGRYELGEWPQVLGGYASAGDGRPVNRRNEVEGKMFVLQSRLLDNRLITTFGLRNDKETQWGDRELNPEYNPDTGEWIADPIPDDPYFSDDGDTTTFGAVFKINDKLRVFYNKADSYEPQGQYESIWNESLEPADGEGEDYGFMLNLFEGKLSTRVSWYNQSANGALETDWKYNRVRGRLIQNMERGIEDWWEKMTPENFTADTGETPTPEEIAELAPRRAWAENLGLSFDDYQEQYTSYSDFTRFTRDFVSKGMEVEMHAKPMKNLDLVFTFGKNESKNLRSLPDGIDFIATRLPVWQKYYNLPRNPNDGDYFVDFLDPETDREFVRNTGDTIPFKSNQNYLANPDDLTIANNRGDSFAFRYLTYADGGAIIALAQEEVGTANTRARKYRANFVANYRFTEGKLKGAGIGGATRWRSKSAIGYQGKINPINPTSTLLVPDTTQPIWGDEQLDFDLWLKYQKKLSIRQKDVNWRIQLNIRNLFDDDKIYGVEAYTDGSIVEWEQKAPRTWMLTNTFEF